MDFDPVHGMTNPMSSTTMTIVSPLDVHNKKVQHDGTSEGWENMGFDPVHGTTDAMSSTIMTIVSALDVHNKKGQHDRTSFMAGDVK